MNPTTQAAKEASFSFVLEHPAADPGAANRHFLARLAVETDPADLSLDLSRGSSAILVIDARSAEAYAECHIPGAINLPHRTISPATVAALPKDRVLVTYCWSPACNASTKAAAKLSALGFRVKELIGGIEYWRKDGYPVEGAAAERTVEV
jgi:rhodanese-related sulfurtransferase